MGFDPMLTCLTICGGILNIEESGDAHCCRGCECSGVCDEGWFEGWSKKELGFRKSRNWRRGSGSDESEGGAKELVGQRHVAAKF